MSEIMDAGSDTAVVDALGDLPDDVLFGSDVIDDPKAGKERGELDQSGELAQGASEQDAGEGEEKEGEEAENAKEGEADEDPEFEITDPSNPEAKQTLKLSELVKSYRDYAAFENEKAAILARETGQARTWAQNHMQQTENAVRQVHAQLQATLQMIKPPIPPDPRNFNDPYDFNVAQYEHNQKMGQYQQAQGLARELMQKANSISAAQREERELVEADALRRVWPEFGKETHDAMIADAEKFYGISKEELEETVTDHRQILILRDAMAYRKAKAEGGDIKAKVVQKAAAKVAQRPQSQTKRTLTQDDARHMNAVKRFKESGGKDMRAGAAAFEKFL